MGRPLVLNFGHPLNQISRQQLERELPGWREWRRADSYHVDDAADPRPEIRKWLRELGEDNPGWAQVSDLYYMPHAFSTANTALLEILRTEHNAKALEISRDRAPDSPVEIFIIYRIEGATVDTSLSQVKPIPGFLVDLGRVPLGEEHKDQVRLLTPTWLDLEYVHVPIPEVRDELKAETIDELIVKMARDHDLKPEEQPCVLAWFRHGTHPNDVVRFMARFHGVTGYFPSMAKFTLKAEFAGASNLDVLHNIENWYVSDIESYGRLRAEGHALRAGIGEDTTPRDPRAPANSGRREVLPTAVALAAFQWPRWGRNHARERARWSTLLDRMEGVLEPGGVRAESAGLDVDIFHALKSFRRPGEWALQGGDAAPFFQAVREYLMTVGKRYHGCLTNLGKVRALLHQGLVEGSTWTFDLEIQAAELQERHVAVKFERLLEEALVPLLQNAASEGACRVSLSSRVEGDGDDESWIIEVKNDGPPFAGLDRVEEKGRIHGGMTALLGFARDHLVTLRVHSRRGERGWETREWHAGTFRWNATRNGLISVGEAVRGWGSVDSLPQRSCPPPPWNVCFEIALPLGVLGE